MISFIVPTLWKCDKINESIDQFYDFNVDNAEFIIIDNLNNTPHQVNINWGYTISSYQTHNIGVNPAWNLGVKLAKNDLICLLNDDLTFNFQTLKNNLDSIAEICDNGIIGFDANTNFSPTLNQDNDVFDFIEAPCRTLGFGCMMIMHKKHYIQIDERMKIYCGDDLLYWWNKDKHQRTVYNIQNLQSTGYLSITSKDYEDVMQSEVDIFQEVVRYLS